MSEFTPPFAPIVVLLFLGSTLLLGVSLIVLLYGAARRSALFAKLGASAAITIGAGYFVLLSGVSIASTDKTLPAGGWKYFCEADCHIAYSIIGTQTATAFGPEAQRVSAHGRFIFVRLKTWFDERTISANRGNSTLAPNPRSAVLVDDNGREFEPSAEAQVAFARLGNASTPLTVPLRPGESYTTDFVFDVPRDASGFRLLIRDDAPETRLLIGHENSPMHKKTYFSLDSALPLGKSAQ